MYLDGRLKNCKAAQGRQELGKVVIARSNPITTAGGVRIIPRDAAPTAKCEQIDHSGVTVHL